MEPFNVNVYYAEQDALMNMPDESIDEIMKRVSSSRRNQADMSSRPVHRLIKTDGTQPGTSPAKADSPLIAEAARSAVPEERSNILNDAIPEDGRNLKRKTSDQQSDMYSGSKHRKTADLDIAQDTSGDRPQTAEAVRVSSDTPAPIINQEMVHRESSPEIEEIESFSIDSPQLQVPSKRKALPGPLDQNQQKQKARKHISAPQPSEAAAVTADHSPILSFSRVESHSPKKSRNSRRDKVIPVLHNPPLDLRPLRAAPTESPTSKNKAKPDPAETDGRDSPIEGATLGAMSPVRVGPKKGLEPEPSEMLLDIKRRIAKHNSEMKKRGDKPSKTRARPAVREPENVTGAAAQSDRDSSVIYISSSPSSRAGSPGQIGDESTKEKQVSDVGQNTSTKIKAIKPTDKSTVSKRQTGAKGKKQKPPPMTASEYAKKLQDFIDKEKAGEDTTEAKEDIALQPFLDRRRRTRSHLLTGNNILYVAKEVGRASDFTRARMDIIASLGANVMSKYDPAVTTHIVADASAYVLLKAIGLPTLGRIPDHIPTVTWDWVLLAKEMPPAYSQGEVEEKLGRYFKYAAFPDRFYAGCQYLNPALRKARRAPKPVDTSVITDFDEEIVDEHGLSNSIGERDTDNQAGPSNLGALPSPPTSPVIPVQGNIDHSGDTSKSEVDPLAEFYEHARDRRQSADRWKKTDTSSAESDDEGTMGPQVPKVHGKESVAIHSKGSNFTGDCPNQDIINKLEELEHLHAAKPTTDDKWRAYTYKKAISALKKLPERIRDYEHARGIQGIGAKTAEKIQEILDTGELRRIGYERTDDIVVGQIFQGIYGVGKSIAHQWYNAGCRTLEDVKNRKGGIKVTPAQELGLKYYDDVNSRMPREEAKAIFDLIVPIAHSIDPKLSMMLMGSYRRGQPDCGDIDIIMTRQPEDGKTHAGVLPVLLNKLHGAGIIAHDLAYPSEPFLEGSYRGLGHLPQEGSTMRRIDILCVPWVSRGAALIYYTGNDIFNRAIRLKAHKMGYSLDQRGLYKNVIRNPSNQREKFDKGVCIASETEEEIFKLLDVPWQEPYERNRI